MYFSVVSPETTQIIESARNNLKNLRDYNFDLLLFCTFVVAIGLFLELPEIVHDMYEIYGRESRELKFWLAPSVERKEYPRRDWVKKWSALGWVLIVVGVMGEGWFEAQVSKYDSALSKITDAVVVKAQQESANAEAIAKGFDAQIAASDAKAKAAEATSKQFEAQIAEAQKEAESEHLARVQLQKEMQARRLTTEQRKKLASVLKDEPPQPLGVGFCIYGTECIDFSNDIGAALKDAKWVPTFLPDTAPKYGIEVGCLKSSDTPSMKHWIKKLRHALSEAGLSSDETLFDPDDKTIAGGFERNVLYLIVNQKPEPKIVP